MFVYKYNQYTKKYYAYNLDLYDINSPMFNETLHSHNDSNVPLTCTPYECGYCNTFFASRNSLFYHLGFMDIDIRKQDDESMETDIENPLLNEYGDYGIINDVSILEAMDISPIVQHKVKPKRSTIHKKKMKKQRRIISTYRYKHRNMIEENLISILQNLSVK